MNQHNEALVMAEILKTLERRQDLHLELIDPTGSSTEELTNFVARQLSQYPDSIKERISSELLSTGPLTALIDNASITEIILNGPNSIFYELDGVILKWREYFLSNVTYYNFIQRIQTESQVQANQQQPYVDGRWRQFRMHLVLPPISKTFPNLTLRRHPKESWSFERLLKNNWADLRPITLIRSAISQKQNILIIGSTGSGKTSLLSACLHECQENCRIIAIEDTDEIQLPNEISTKLLTRYDPSEHLKEINQETLLKQALRMRPERLILGEVRGAEAKDLILTLSSGHRGSLATLHASTPEEALWRLEVLTQMGAPSWRSETIQQLIKLGFDIIISVKQTEGKRHLDEVVRISSLERSNYTFERLWPRP